ncbi:MAG: DUF4065 domain-containing protein [Sphaerochaeta sp.]|nr:DUF4065 domain-containing protein [Sphaerochaeta sp.]
MAKVPIRAMDVARYITGMMSVDNLKLQKLLYYSQAVHLIRFDERLFADAIEAWRYGPVVRDVYNHYKKYGFEQIPNSSAEEEAPNLCLEQLESVDLVLGYYGEMSAIRLVNETHSEKPWKDAYDPLHENREISIEAISVFYKDVFDFSN